MENKSLDYSYLYTDFYKNKVYLPSDDTFFFTDVLLKDFDYIFNRKPSLVLELGCGSGYISTYFLKLFNKTHENSDDENKEEINKDNKNKDIYTPLCLSVDINKYANMSTMDMIKSNNLDQHCESICMDLFNNFRRVEFDIIMFNPPYVQGTPKEVTNVIDMAWNGGINGCETIKRFLNEVDRYLAKEGVVYLVNK